MGDYIEFLNWPDIDAYYEKHPFDSMDLMEIYSIYIEMKNKNPMISDEELSISVGKRAYYFYHIKVKIRRLSCEKRLLRSV